MDGRGVEAAETGISGDSSKKEVGAGDAPAIEIKIMDGRGDEAAAGTDRSDDLALKTMGAGDAPVNEKSDYLVMPKKNSRPTENEDLFSASEELPVKRVRFEYTLKDESNSSNTDDNVEGERKCGLSKASDVAVVKSLKPQAESLHKVKWVDLNGKIIPIVTQNENGPCPLIAIANILLLRKKICLRDDVSEVAADELMEYIRTALHNTEPKDGDFSNPNYIQNMQDAYAVISHLKTGLDVNVKFTGVTNFEYTPECIIFDMLDIHLYHGWLLDPQSAEVVSAVSNLSYNQLVEMIITKKASKDTEEQAQAEIAKQFLESTASQLTCHGLCELNSAMENGEMAVLFRNNHFSMIYKNKDMLCQLVTDQGYLNEKRVVWETLSTICGDETFLDGSFTSLLPKSLGASSLLNAIEDQQISHDFLVALSLQDEQNKLQDKEYDWEAYDNGLGANGITSDEKIARRLLIEEQRMSQVTVTTVRTAVDVPTQGAVQRSRYTPVSSQHVGPTTAKETEEAKSKGWRCTIS